MHWVELWVTIQILPRPDNNFTTPTSWFYNAQIKILPHPQLMLTTPRSLPTISNTAPSSTSFMIDNALSRVSGWQSWFRRKSVYMGKFAPFYFHPFSPLVGGRTYNWTYWIIYLGLWNKIWKRANSKLGELVAGL